METKNELQLTKKAEIELAKNLDAAVNEIILSQASGFERLYIQSQAVSMIKASLTDEFMKPIMELQNKKLGFKTDEKQGYRVDIVRDCVIEARFYGL